MELGGNEQADHDLDRRTLLRRAAVVGGATVWAVPTVQSLAGPAFATGTPRCKACLTGGGFITGGTLNGIALRGVSYGLSKLCCGDDKAQIEVVAHPTRGGAVQWHFSENFTMACSKTGNPAPPPQTAECPNQFTGQATTPLSKPGISTLQFQFQDFGEPGELDTVTIGVTGPQGTLAASGIRTGGNLQAHQAKRSCDCV